MIRIAGVNIPKEKHVFISLTYIFGIGKSISKKICNKLNICCKEKLSNVNNETIDKLNKEILNYDIEGDLKQIISFNIKRLIDINSYRGIRHRKNLPTRGQRTKTNAKTRKKNKRNK